MLEENFSMCIFTKQDLSVVILVCPFMVWLVKGERDGCLSTFTIW